VKDRPILFNGGMVRALLAGRKTQTRRPIKPQPMAAHHVDVCHYSPTGWALWKHGSTPKPADPRDAWGRCLCSREVTCPFGQAGDRLWVRETWAMNDIYWGWAKIPVDRPDSLSELAYRADGEWKDQHAQCDGDLPSWRPSIHMPRWASRISLEITGVRAEQLWEISDEDRDREGQGDKPFGTIWEQVYGPQGLGWDANPWVWVLEFRRIA
jgi:hypothetical protein